MPRKTNTTIEQVGTCHIWRGPLDAYGRPISHKDGKPYRVQHAILQTKLGHKPYRVKNICKNLACVNPEHLIEDTQAPIQNLPPKINLLSMLANLDLDLEEKEVLTRELTKPQVK